VHPGFLGFSKCGDEKKSQTRKHVSQLKFRIVAKLKYGHSVTLSSAAPKVFRKPNDEKDVPEFLEASTWHFTSGLLGMFQRTSVVGDMQWRIV